VVLIFSQTINIFLQLLHFLLCHSLPYHHRLMVAG